MPAVSFFVKLFSTFFYIGYLPFIPGTFGSIAGVFLFFLLKNNFFGYAITLVIILVLGFLTAGKTEDLSGRKDPRFVVIDEVAGMLISFAFLPFSLPVVAAGFLLFRLLDTLKPYPAAALQEKHGSLGIMSDDIIAGLYANIVLQVVLRLTAFMAS